MAMLMQWFCSLCVLHPWCKKIPKDANNLWYAPHRMQRSIDRHEDVIVEYTVCVISVAVLVAVVTRCLFLVVFVKYVLYKRRSTFLFQQTVLIQSFGVCLQISCVVTKDPGTHCFWNWDSMVLDWDSWFFKRWVSGLTITICNKITANGLHLPKRD